MCSAACPPIQKGARCILNKNKCLTKLRKSTVLHLKTQNEGHIVRPSSGFSGACCKIQNFATGPFAYSTPVEMIKALSYLMQIVGILYIFCDISRLAAKRPTNFTEIILPKWIQEIGKIKKCAFAV